MKSRNETTRFHTERFYRRFTPHLLTQGEAGNDKSKIRYHNTYIKRCGGHRRERGGSSASPIAIHGTKFPLRPLCTLR